MTTAKIGPLPPSALPFYLPPPVVRESLRPIYWAVLNQHWSWARQRKLLDAAAALTVMPKGVDVTRVVLGGRPAESLSPSAGSSGAVLYLHGGGFTIGSLRTHRALAANIALVTGAEVFTLDYRMAPEHPYPAAVDDAVAAFVELLARRGGSAAEIAIAGDSAGGGVAAAATRRLIDGHGLTPGTLVLIAPAVDPAASKSGRAKDIVVRTAWAQTAVAAYRGDAAEDDPGFAPIHAPTTGFPPTFVTVGTAEVLHDQVCAYVEHLRAGGVEVEFATSDVLWHVAQMQSAVVKPAAESLAQIGTFIRTHAA